MCEYLRLEFYDSTYYAFMLYTLLNDDALMKDWMRQPFAVDKLLVKISRCSDTETREKLRQDLVLKERLCLTLQCEVYSRVLKKESEAYIAKLRRQDEELYDADFETDTESDSGPSRGATGHPRARRARRKVAPSLETPTLPDCSDDLLARVTDMMTATSITEVVFTTLPQDAAGGR